MVELDVVDIGFKLFGVIILVIILLFFLTWSGIVRCGDIPYWCDVYETVMGSPRVLIVHGDSGLGNPDELKSLLTDPTKVGVNAVDVIHLDRVSSGNLQRYKLVIVENAKKMSIDQLSMFIDYVQIGGGRLIWVGDAGTERGDDELNESIDVNDDRLKLDNPWARARETQTEYVVLNFDEFLGLKYVGNYCAEIMCAEENFSPGIIMTEVTGSHFLIYGLTPALELKINPQRDFAIVSQLSNISNSNIVLSLDQGSLKQGKEKQFQRHLPIIATSGLGEKIAYYAYPLEYYCKDNNTPNACVLLLKQMFYGMLGK
ncbi:MAG: hypothetical protein PHP82_03775 [Candidatus ainarchaeum sp.]|nr:hypothetical protein [Candidatus ainarchaeum sp.]